MRSSRFARPPRGLTRRGVKLDNVALVPASLLPFKVHWQRLANELPTGEMLIVLPDHTKQQRVVRSVTASLEEKGRRVRLRTLRTGLM